MKVVLRNYGQYFQNYSMGHIKMKLKEPQPTNGTEQQQQQQASTDQKPSEPNIETSKVRSLFSLFSFTVSSPLDPVVSSSHHLITHHHMT